jgi:hypothetical protein
LEKCLLLFFQLFETYEGVIEKRVEKKRELIEIKERERIIDDYRKKLIDINTKHESLKEEHAILKEKYHKTDHKE